MNLPEQELIPLSSREKWMTRLNEIPHHFSHTLEHCQAMYLSTGYPTYLYSFRHNNILVLCPICERSFDGYTDIVTPYGFNGFISNGDYPEFNSYWINFCKARAYVCSYFGCHPLMNYDLGFSKEEVKIGNEVYLLDLTIGIENIISRMSDNRKRQLKKMSKDSHHVSFDKNKLTDYFVDNYTKFIVEKGARGTYHFNDSTLQMLVNMENVFMTGFIDDGHVEAVSLFGYTPYSGDFLFNISSEKGKENSFTLMWMAIERLSSMKIPFLNLGGGVTQGDSLAAFKKRFGGMARNLEGIQQVYSPFVFNELCAKTGKNIHNTSYFPPYRDLQN